MSVWATVRFTPRDNGRFVSAVVTPGVLASGDAASQMIVDLAKQYCPVLTGLLQSRITYKRVQSEHSARWYVYVDGVPYATFVEFGTGIRGAASPGAGSGPYSPTWPGQAAQPYMRPAVDESKPAINDLFRSNLAVGIGSPYA